MSKLHFIDVDPEWLAEQGVCQESKDALLAEFQDGLIAGAVGWLEAGGYDAADIDSMVHNFLEEYEIADYGDCMDVHWNGELFLGWDTIKVYLEANGVTLAEFRTILAEKQFSELPETFPEYLPEHSGKELDKVWAQHVKPYVAKPAKTPKPYYPAKTKTKRQKKVARPVPKPIVITNETTILVAIKKQPRRLI